MEEESSTLTKTWRVGGSIVVTLPTNLVKEKSIQENEIIEIKIKKQRKNYFGALKGIGSFTKEDRAKGQLES